MKKIFVTLFALLSLAVSALGQEYAIEILPDKKIIYPERMNLPENTNIQSLLQMVPELMQRGDEMFSHYDIQYDGKSIGESRDVLLVHTKIGEIQKIEIHDSAIATQQKNGRSGVINLKPKPLEVGFGGEANLSATTECDIMPNVILNYSDGKFSVHGQANVEYYNAYDRRDFEETTEEYIKTGYEGVGGHYLQETGKVDLQYCFDGQNKLKAWLIESASRTRDLSVNRNDFRQDGRETVGPGWWYEWSTVDSTRTNTNKVWVNAMAEYEHLFSDASKLTAFAGYCVDRSEQNGLQTIPRSLDNSVKYEWIPVKNDFRELKTTVGINTSYNNTTTASLSMKDFSVSPYTTLKYSGEAWKIYMTLRYKHYVRNFKNQEEKAHVLRDNDIEADLRAVWQIRPHHALKFSVARAMERPSDWMMLPGIYYNIEKKLWIMGNPELDKAYVHSAEVEYIFDHQKGDHGFIVNASAGFDHASGVIEQVPGHTGPTYYVEYQNSGTDNIIKGMASLTYKYRRLSLSFAANVFGNYFRRQGNLDHDTSFNLCLTPIIKFNNGWSLGSRAIYNSPVSRKNTVLGDSFCLQLKVSKAWPRWTVGAEINDVFDYQSVDVIRTETSKHVRSYDLFPRYFALFAVFRLGNMVK